MDTMNWAGQVCRQMLGLTLPALTLAVCFAFLSLLFWAGASLTRRAR